MTTDKKMQTTEHATPERLNAFSDGVFAIIITIMVLELKKPEEPTFEALFHLWPTWISYAVSYLFIAIVWVNHHYLLKYARAASFRLIWGNFAHLFSVSLIPILTVWIAESKLAPVPVALYAAVFLLVNITYLVLAWECLGVRKDDATSVRIRKLLHIRSFFTISLFFLAMVVSFWFPYLGLGLICCCLGLYLRPEIPGKPGY